MSHQRQETSAVALVSSEWSPLPLARAILAEYDPAPYALIAAWKCVYRDDCAMLTDLAYRAAAIE